MKTSSLHLWDSGTSAGVELGSRNQRTVQEQNHHQRLALKRPWQVGRLHARCDRVVLADRLRTRLGRAHGVLAADGPCRWSVHDGEKPNFRDRGLSDPASPAGRSIHVQSR